MALQKSKKREIPEDAVLLTETQAYLYQTKILKNWPISSDTFFYKYGIGILAAGASLTGAYANIYFRRKFKLFDYGKIVSFLPIAVVPGALSVLVHDEFVLKKLVIRNYECPICLQTRAAALQAMFGCVLPFVIAPCAALSLVSRYSTFDMPYISQEPMKVFKILGKQYMRMKNLGFGIFLSQALVASVVTYLEADSINKVNFKLLEIERNKEFVN